MSFEMAHIKSQTGTINYYPHTFNKISSITKL